MFFGEKNRAGWILLRIIFLLAIGSPLVASAADSTQCLKVLALEEASYSGKTKNNNPYQVYAIRQRKDWILIVVDSTNQTVFYKNKKGEVAQADDGYKENICTILTKRWYVKEAQRVDLEEDLPLYCYYRLTRRGKVYYKASGSGAAVDEYKGLFAKIWNVVKAPVKLVFGKKGSKKMQQMEVKAKKPINTEKTIEKSVRESQEVKKEIEQKK